MAQDSPSLRKKAKKTTTRGTRSRGSGGGEEAIKVARPETQLGSRWREWSWHQPPQPLCASAAAKISVTNQHLLAALANCSGLAPSTAYCSQNNCLLLFLGPRISF